VIDIRLPDVNGLDFQAQLTQMGVRLPVVMITGYGDIPMSVRAMKRGAVDFFTKPFRDQDMLDAVLAAIERDRQRRAADDDLSRIQERFDSLQKQQQLTDRVSELGNLAIEAANAQNWPQALQKMNEAIQLCGNCPQSAHLHKNLGLFYGRAGNIGEARKELQTALELEPNDRDVRNALAALDRAHEEESK